MYNLDKPIVVQYGLWLKKIVKLDFGESFSTDRRPVLDKIWDRKQPLPDRRLFITFMLNLITMVIILAIAIPLGISSATHQYSLYDKLTTTFVFLGFAMPSFWLALLLMMFFGIHLDLLPLSGLKSMNYDSLSLFGKILDRINHLILPVFVSAFTGLAGDSRYMRSSMLEVIRQDYITVARAKGLPEKKVIYNHALKNAILPLITLIGLSVPGLIGGSVIMESILADTRHGADVFYERYDAGLSDGDEPSHNRAVLTLAGNLLADIGYMLADPRIRASKKMDPKRLFWKRFSRNKLAMAGGIIVVFLFFVAILAPLVSPYDPNDIDRKHILEPPGIQHPLGTDDLGRDVLSRMIWGSQISLSVGFVAVGISVVMGMIFGSLSGYYGGWMDRIIMRFIDIMLSVPTFFLILAVIAFIGSSIWNIMIIIGITSWMGVARLVRAEFLSLKEREYVLAARAVGQAICGLSSGI